LIAIAALLIGLTFWQGRWGFRRGPNGLEEAVPIDYAVKSAGKEGNQLYQLRNLRIAMFVLGTVAVILVVFAIAARLTPGPLKAILLFAALILFALCVIAWVAFGFGINEVQEAEECAHYVLSFPQGKFAYGPSDICDDRRQLSTATVVMDACVATFAFLLFVALLFTTTKKNWAWGPGRMSIEKSANQPAINYPPPSPFTYVAETRRTYVYILLFFVGAFVLMDWILTLTLHGIRTQVKFIDQETQHDIIKSGWPIQKNRFRLAIAVITFGFLVLNLLDLLSTKRRWIAYLHGVILFCLAAALFVVFAFDVHSINEAKDLACPEGPWGVPGYGTIPASSFEVTCVHWQYQATAFVDFALAFLLLLFVIFEYLYRSTATWNTYYFFGDSEWLRNHSIFVDATDREAYDWKRYTMETGRDYYYSPTLGISTRVRPRNYVDPDFIAPLY
jgi:Ca2+/Na+ antiporter